MLTNFLLVFLFQINERNFHVLVSFSLRKSVKRKVFFVGILNCLKPVSFVIVHSFCQNISFNNIISNRIVDVSNLFDSNMH